ncbi:rhomboid family intramembrane serine protease [Tautonia sociabilis]|uniref:Rhomboid family intramembrane serine protease n=1 Tax=Tautonia sociabilis TaxID=2080755 RepID=A0A432MC93_9BACT|nr:rhomboid family intramembrane serine protease [Tautonia sociabilis]RUL81744.1 rhomboid family intramembrane serine protease [Tautonia sociabilis]
MRQIGTLPEEQALRFADFLLTRGITSRVEQTNNGCAIWIHREDHLDRAREELRAFLEEPDAARYVEARREAEAVRRRQRQADREHARKTIPLRDRFSRPGGRLGPLTRALLAACLVVFLLNWIGPPIAGRSLYGWLFFTDWFVRGGNAGLGPILGGQVWRLVSPIFVHFGPWHLIFNLYMVSQLGSAIERHRGTAEFGLLVLIAAVVSNFAQFALPDVFTAPTARVGDGPFGGMSGVLYALFGYAWMRGRYDPASGLVLHPQTVLLLMIWLVVCFFNLLGPIANTAHVAGLVVGIGFCFASMGRDGVFR